MISAVIFDMDGTMVKTEELWKEVNEELAISYGKVFNPEVRVHMIGRKEADALRVFKEYYHLDVPLEELVQARTKLLFEKLNKVTANKGLFELLDLLNKLHIKKAIATSSTREFARKIIEMIGVTHEFEVFITGDDVIHGKPDPEIFLLTAKQLQVDQHTCLVLEDAQNGVEAAVRAEMRVFAIPHAHTQLHDFSKATKILDSMLDINENLLKSV